MNKKTFATILLVPFSALTVYAIYKVGYIGVFDYHRHSPAGWQVFADLVIACLLLLSWLIPEAKKNGRNPWPFVVVTVFLGSLGPLLYLATDNTK
jgi:hypothetical protein